MIKAAYLDMSGAAHGGKHYLRHYDASAVAD